jgi:hypothetical protein
MDKFCFRRKRIEKNCFDYARNSYRGEFSDFPPHSYSRALSRFSDGSNHHSYGLALRENGFVSKCFGYISCPHHGDHFPCRPSFSTGGSNTHLGPRHLNGQYFPHHSSRPTGSNGEI